ncbi:hypothetical protein [Maritalea porphyrae]|uniref:hypothetical protein n=1 Tax=Maritalea porphyrae TaxID=880732 RepID=UPI0022B01222|nr:hypothetical protein [Maritalea porphyrae]MCZ4273108.1 hypothetical protein [Maritalea porphyrae]
MAWLKSFIALVLLQAVIWGGTHFYYSTNPKQVLLVVDTSYAMKSNFTDAQKWIDDFVASTRYTNIEVGTDKVALGNLKDLRSQDVLFRTAFGRISAENVSALYANANAPTKYLLTSEPLTLEGWQVVSW